MKKTTAGPRYLLSICSFVFIFILSNAALAGRMTERFGGSAPTLDISEVMEDAWFSYYSPNTTSQVLYSSYGKPFELAVGMSQRIAVRIDLDNIPPGTNIIKATYVLPFSSKTYPLYNDAYDLGLSLYRILDPSGTGTWDLGTINTRYKQQPEQGDAVPWTDEGGTFADCVDPEPVDTVHSVGQGTIQFYYFTITDLVQEWVDSPGANLGFSFDAAVASDRMENPNLRPYLEITYDTPGAEPPDQVSGVDVFHRSGQTFITWQENGYTGQFYDINYRIYRHTTPITRHNLDQAQLVGEVFQGSSHNANRSYRSGEHHNYKIIEGDPELTDATGLYVYTPSLAGEFFYAVTFSKEGDENRRDFSSGNTTPLAVVESIQTPGAVLQNAWDNNGDTVQEFVHWADTTMSYRPGYGFNFMMNLDSNYSSLAAVPLEIALTGRTANYRQTWVNSDMVTIWYSDYLPPTKNMPLDGVQDGTVFPELDNGGLYDSLQTWYSGCSSFYKTQNKLSDGIFVPYTENRILHALGVAQDRYNIDPNRIYLRGGSMGGTGSMSLGLKHPEVFASVTATVGCPNWRLNIHEIDDAYAVVREGWRSEGNKLWGKEGDAVLHENGTPIWDWMNAGWYAKNHAGQDMPFLSMGNGKRDGSIVFFPHARFYKDMKDAGQAFVADFFDGGHSSGSAYDPRFGTLLKNESIPALKNVSLDDDPGSIHEPTGMTAVVSSAPLVFTGDPQGEINGYRLLEWSRSCKQFSNTDAADDLVDLPSRYEMAFRVEPSSPHTQASIDITPRKLQRFQVTASREYYWENKDLSDHQIIQSGRVIANGNGLITIPGFEVRQSLMGNKLIIIPASGQEPIKPVLDPIGDKRIGQGETLVFTINGFDGNNDPLVFSASPLPPGATFDPGSRTFSWTPGNPDAGNYDVTFTVTDGALSDEETITVSFDATAPVVTINEPPGGLTQDQGMISLSGNMTDDVAVASATCIITYPDNTTEERPIRLVSGAWQATGLYLAKGSNTITITALDLLGHSTVKTLIINRIVPERTQVVVSSVPELENAVSSLESNREILIMDGTYDISSMMVVGGTWANSSTLSNVVIRSQSGNREAVVLKGTGMYTPGNADVMFLFRNIVDFTLADLTLKEVFYHPIQVQGEQGGNRPCFKNLHIIDAGEQFIKVTRSTDDQLFCNRGIVERCLFEFTTHAKHWPAWGYYTDAVDVLGGDGWIIRDNTFSNIRAPHDGISPDGIAGAVILMWCECKNTIVERNRFIECDMGIQFGNPGGDGVDHDGGIIRNNIFSRTGEGDVAISLNRASNIKVLHNTVMHHNTFPWTMEYRYQAENAQPSGEFLANLTDGPIVARNNAVARVEDNLTHAEPQWFVNDGGDDLHLVQGAPPIDQVTASEFAADDMDGEPRYPGIPADIGADEFQPFDPDMDKDLDVDGEDIALIIASGRDIREIIIALAHAFGR
ncbi:MAG: right-handed parallel beta-helix repeat-containing protein [Desulfobacterium sp.]|nr:right-handed parallel beta-helix repeat-containing protein [Desulfobacterium sp.]